MDRRIFTQVARDSEKWKKTYKKRTAVERINARLDRDYKFEKHTIRGIEKMKMYVSISLIMMLVLAKSKIEERLSSGEEIEKTLNRLVG